MPKLWMTDDYEECLELPGPDDPDGVYCTVTVVLKPNNQSDLWRLIEVYMILSLFGVTVLLGHVLTWTRCSE